MLYENEFDGENKALPENNTNTPENAENTQEAVIEAEKKEEIREKIKEQLPETDSTEYERIDSEISEVFSKADCTRSANTLPENTVQTNASAESTAKPEIPETPIQPEKHESAGIRYNADAGDKNGTYTWNYSDSINSTATEPKKAKRKGFVVFIAAAMVLLLIGTAALSSAVTSSLIRRNGEIKDFSGDEASSHIIGQNKDTEAGTRPVVQVPDVLGESLTKQQIAVKCKPSSVGIEVVSTTSSFYGYSYQSRGVGSGFILTEDGYIATNHHVVNGAGKITVQLDDGTKFDATLVGSDAITDLAVLKIEATGLTPMQIGDSDKMVVGDAVIAIGTPAGIEFAGTVTDGIISAINRDVEITNDRGTVVKRMTLMQTNAAINPGNSGGPLINDKGEVIGINTLKLNSTYEGIGFSIPINSAVKIFNQLIKDGKVSEYDTSFVTGNGSIGITQYAEISKQEAQYYGIPEGIIVIQIQNTSSAVTAGLRRGDIIIGFCGEKATTVDELNRLKSKYRAGEEVTLRIYRDGEGEKDITFKLDMMQS